jgi:hypothetical protein
MATAESVGFSRLTGFETYPSADSRDYQSIYAISAIAFILVLGSSIWRIPGIFLSR